MNKQKISIKNKYLTTIIIPFTFILFSCQKKLTNTTASMVIVNKYYDGSLKEVIEEIDIKDYTTSKHSTSEKLKKLQDAGLATYYYNDDF